MAAWDTIFINGEILFSKNIVRQKITLKAVRIAIIITLSANAARLSDQGR